ncbi:MAG: TolC family protein [Muribaculaceae bacterium]|jgi:outer membrane protein TolC|nr:TolC family protein [Muribaculaceae bacterium]
MIKKIIISVSLMSMALFAYSQNIGSTRDRHVVSVQSAAPDSIKAMLDEYEKISLPPLSVFLASAEEHPSLQIYKARVAEAEADKKISDRGWLDYLRFNGMYSYGYNNIMSNMYSGSDVVVYDKNNTAQHHFSVGATLSIPLGDLLNQKYKRRKMQAKLDQLKYEYQASLEDRKLTILSAYNTVLEQLATIKVKAEAAALYNAQMQISEDDYVNGKIDIISLSLERGRRSTAISQYQQGRVALHNAITLLEMLTSVTIMKK